MAPTGSAILSDEQIRSLRAVAGLMIPPSAAHGVPGADDERIFADLVATLERDGAQVRLALGWLDDAAGGCLADLPDAARHEACERLRHEAPDLAGVLVNVIVRCYYRDDRVVRSLELPVRAPYPQGFEVTPGDYSLTAPVVARGRIWRAA